MQVDENDYSKQAIIDRLNHAKEVYQNAGNSAGIEAATEAISSAELANTDSDARQVELNFNAGDFGPDSGDFGSGDDGPVDLDAPEFGAPASVDDTQSTSPSQETNDSPQFGASYSGDDTPSVSPSPETNVPDNPDTQQPTSDNSPSTFPAVEPDDPQQSDTQSPTDNATQTNEQTAPEQDNNQPDTSPDHDDNEHDDNEHDGGDDRE